MRSPVKTSTGGVHWRALLVLLACISSSQVSSAQDLEPRRWAHMPMGTNILGLSYAHLQGDLFFDPVLELQDTDLRSDLLVTSYTRTFGLAGKMARVDAILPYVAQSKWDGTLSGDPASTQREGFGDPWIRLSVNLVGSPALKGQAYQDYRRSKPENTVVGVALAVALPLGEYQPDKLLNLGSNRFTIRPQVGVTHTNGSWIYELTGSIFFFTDNDDFFGGKRRQQQPLGALQAHVTHSFPNRWWASLGVGYSWNGDSTIDGVAKDDKRSHLLSAISLGLPVGKSQALKFGYLRGDTQNDVGANTNSLFAGWSLRF